MLYKLERNYQCMHKTRLLLILTLLISLLAGCGNRGIPVIKQELLDQKMSVLMLSSSGLSASAKDVLGQTLKNWRDGNSIAYEWVKDLNALDDNVDSKLKSKTYDYIYVVGNELFPSANEKMALGLTTSKWTFLQSQPFAEGSAITVNEQASLLQLDLQQIETMKNKAIQDLLFQNVVIEWVTQSERPIPSAWAPSEEADHIVLLNNNNQWFQQLTFQVHQHHAAWVIFYSPVSEDQLQKAKSLGVSVMDFAGALTADLNWTQIFDNRLAMMKTHAWQKGIQNYNPQELKELKMK
ncbi:hypothetical protein PAECIP111891_02322 [Paenibacillus allorhizoplanae]|uniref:Lipoprotein n=1 Tax=Paenibacillus allorhizoplanae TaxID=2905648 RepID=A0ABM9C6B5_9BACL|nr:hypothetical protein [Paenibacillus allorhizoplanae]CAH1203435.1 hypothetical protein PAECIP111891_02322 [Paenibacillus allorhizoplanae]